MPVLLPVSSITVPQTMAVIAHLRIPAEAFELGRILELKQHGTIELENMIPIGERAVPFFSVSDAVRASFEKNVESNPSVESINQVTQHDGERLYTNTRRIHPPSREERVFRPHRSEPSDEQAGDEADLL